MCYSVYIYIYYYNCIIHGSQVVITIFNWWQFPSSSTGYKLQAPWLQNRTPDTATDPLTLGLSLVLWDLWDPLRTAFREAQFRLPSTTDCRGSDWLFSSCETGGWWKTSWFWGMFTSSGKLSKCDPGACWRMRHTSCLPPHHSGNGQIHPSAFIDLYTDLVTFYTAANLLPGPRTRSVKSGVRMGTVRGLSHR